MRFLKNHKRESIIAVVIVIVLVVAFFYESGSVGYQPSLPSETVVESEYNKPETECKGETVKIEPAENLQATTSEEDIASNEEDNKYETQPETEEVISDNDELEYVDNNTETDSQTENICTLSVRCDTLLYNLSLLDESKKELVPEDGILFLSENVEFFQGETVFNVLLREMKKNKIHMDFVSTPLYNSVYIKGISNIYEKDLGELSGWIYRVNGEIPSVGCSGFKLSPGDVIQWDYVLSP